MASVDLEPALHRPDGHVLQTARQPQASPFSHGHIAACLFEDGPDIKVWIAKDRGMDSR